MGLNEDLGDRENVGNASLSVARSRQQKKVFWKQGYNGDFCVFRTYQNLCDSMYFDLDGAEIGEKFEVSTVELTEEEFEDLGEFEGW